MTARARVALGYAALASGGVALIVGLHRANPRFLVSAHGFLHAAIVQRFWADGFVVPPENPFFAGEPLPYYWVLHALAAGLGGLLGIDPLHALELCIVLAWLVLVASCAALAPRLYGRAGLGILAAWLVVAGANLQAPLLAGYRLLRVGPELLQDRGTYLWGLAHPMLGHMRMWDGGALYGPLVNFFLNITSRPTALAGLVVMVLALERSLRGGRLAALGLAAATAGTTALSVLVGLPGAAALGGGIVVAAAHRRLRRDGEAWPGVAATLLALAVGAALGFVPAAHLRGAGAAGLLVGGLPRLAEKLGATLAAAWPVMALAALAWWRAEGPRRGFLEVLGLAAAALALGNLLLALPVGNEVNLYHAALVLLALASAAAFAGGGAGARRAAWITGLAFVPTFALVVLCYAVRPPLPIVADGRRLLRADLPDGGAYAWIARETPPDAVLLVEPGPPPLALGGNTCEAAALADRVLFTERPSHYVVAPLADAPARADLAHRLLQGEPPRPDDLARLRALGRPLYLLVDPRIEAPARDAIDRRLGPARYRQGAWAVYALPLDRDAGAEGG